MSDIQAQVKRGHCLDVLTSITQHVGLTTCMHDPQLKHVAAGKMSTEREKKKSGVTEKTFEGAALQGN